MRKNKTGYFKHYETHIALFDQHNRHLGNVNDWKELERFGKRQGYFFAKELK